VYDLFFAILGLGYKSNKVKEHNLREFSIVIPAYKEGLVLLETVEKALNVSYPRSLFEVVVLGQDLKEEVVDALRAYDIKLVLTGGLGSKFNALKNYLTHYQVKNHLLILDADNLIEPSALTIASSELNTFDLVQLARKKTEASGSLGILDRWNTAISIHLSNESRAFFGLNPLVLGSGFAVPTEIYRGFLETSQNTVAEDKALDLYMATKGLTLSYVDESWVVDFTTEKGHAFESQRNRWVGGRVEAARQSRLLWFKSMFNLELFDKALHYNAPQRSLFIAFQVIALLFSFFISWEQAWMVSVAILSITVLGILLSTPRDFFSIKTLVAIGAIPGSIWKILKARIVANRTLKKDFTVTPK
jgi:cellulose synthase/poly-beta-1,6-N-acetylglucosamine synthase-like glycosyltransferase